MEKVEKLPHYIIPIFVPHLGCPHDCIFCNQKKITNKSTDISIDNVKNKIEEYLSYFNKDAFIEIAFYGGSFTAIDKDIQRQLLSLAFSYKRKGLINEIRLSTRPDAIDIDRLNLLRAYEVDTIELGVQSMDEEVLINSIRGHDSQSVYRAVSLIKEYGFKLGLQMMLGLPGDSLEKDIKTALDFIKLDPDCVRIYPTLVIKDTYLEKDYLRGDYEALNLDEAIDISTILLMLFYINNINVIRVGLQVTDNIQEGKDVIAGPFHPAFRQLVESNIFLNILDRRIKSFKDDLKNGELIINSNSKHISNIIGQKAFNKDYLLEEYKLKKVKINDDLKDINTIYLQDKDKEVNIKVDLNREIKEILEEKLDLIES